MLISSECQTDPVVQVIKENICTSFSKPDFVPKYMKPYHIRLREYKEVKSRIFNEAITTTNLKKNVKRSTKRLRKFWSNVVKNRKSICSAIISDKNTFDIRPFATVNLFGEDVVGMIDTGATISCFASGYARKFLEENKHPWEKFTVFLKTADGKSTPRLVGYPQQLCLGETLETYHF